MQKMQDNRSNAVMSLGAPHGFDKLSFDRLSFDKLSYRQRRGGGGFDKLSHHPGG
nr:hypothetical protein [Oscillochloris trichoides]